MVNAVRCAIEVQNAMVERNAGLPPERRIEFRGLNASCTVRIYTVRGDLVQTLHHDGHHDGGSVAWNLMSRNGQEVVSGIYLYAVRPLEPGFEDFVGKFVVIR